MITMLLGRVTRAVGLLPARSNQRRYADAGEDAGAEMAATGAS
jgi:hypothetical protein